MKIGLIEKTRDLFIKANNKRFIFLCLLLSVKYLSFGQTISEECMLPLIDDQKDIIFKFPPQVFKLEKSLGAIFPIPFDDAVGTNRLGNEITSLSFHQDQIIFRSHFRNVSNYVSGGELSYLPVYSESGIGFGQSRRFAFYDFKRNDHQYYSICTSLNTSIESVKVVDSKANTFIFEIYHGKGNYLRLIQLDEKNGDVNIIEEIPIGDKNWTIGDDKVFVYSRRDDKLEVYDLNLKPSHHILENIFKGKTIQELYSLHFHPSLPIAIAEEWSRDEMRIIHWKDNDLTIKLLHNGNNAEFSADGKWLFYRLRSKYYLSAVTADLSDFISASVYLGEFRRKDKFRTHTWVTNPISLVASSMNNQLLKWDLKNGPIETINDDFWENSEGNPHRFWEYIIYLDRIMRDNEESDA